MPPANETAKCSTKQKPKRDWEAVDWTKQDIVIADELACTRERVRQKRRALGEPDPERKLLRRNRLEDRLLQLDTSDMTIREVADAIGASYDHACKLLGENQLPHRFEGLVNERLEEIKALHAEGLTDYAIAKRLGLMAGTVSTKLRGIGIPSNDRTHAVARRGEEAVLWKLLDLGFDATLVSDREPYDIDCGGARIEVKTSRLNRDNSLTWSFTRMARSNLKPDGTTYIYERDYAASTDFAVLVWLRPDPPDWFWVVPVSELAGREWVSMVPQPRFPRNSKTREWLSTRRDRFDLITEQAQQAAKEPA